MAVAPHPDVPCAKGALCYCFDEFSRRRGARGRIEKLRDAIVGLGPPYNGLADVFDKYLMSHVIKSAERRARIVAYLNEHWFGESQSFFGATPIAQIYAEGVLKALEFSLNAARVVPLNAWWVLDTKETKLLVLADQNKAGQTMGGRVTLLILTPRPDDEGTADNRPILGDTAQAWVTEVVGSEVLTRNVRDLPQT